MIIKAALTICLSTGSGVAVEDTMQKSDIDNWFTYHAPNPDQQKAYTDLRNKAKELAEMFNDYATDCADKTAAMRELRNTVMAMNLAIACNGNGPNA